ncbi:hypothetical protein [Streptomyces sp. NEAU-H3]|uniref:hypothetical protein n=1 Tax=Streptomyces sp. NEAU-H3 TaxID=2720636 RepID=UPI001439B37B|nr:hypothetical protein [Streptomyces sp. NEAU-H3]NJA57075.1 hypothetical protein [Streptomyces sp. NEAU-H3]
MDRARILACAFAATAVCGALTATPATASAGAADVRTAAADPAYKILKHLDHSGPGKASLRAGYYDRARDKGVITLYCEGAVRCPNWVSTTVAKENKQSAAPAEDAYVSSSAPLAQRLNAPARSAP